MAGSLKMLFGKSSCVGLLFLTFIVGTNYAAAQNPVSLSMSVNPAKVEAGGKLTAQISGSIGGGWHMYSVTQGAGGPIPTRITVPAGVFRLAGAVRGSTPKREMDPNFGIMTEFYAGSVSFSVPVAVDATAQPGSQALTINVRYQVCNDTICLPPKTVKLSAPVEIFAGRIDNTVAAITPVPSPKAIAKNQDSNGDADSASDPDANTNVTVASQTETANTKTDPVSNQIESTASNAPPSSNFTSSGIDLDSSLWAFLWAAAIAGALSLFTPCVFPMIPITVSYFTNHSGGTRGKATVNAFVFALGIIFTFTVLGVMLAVLFGAAGINKFAANPYINIFIAGLFIAFALSLFGAFDLGLPPSILTKLDSISRGRESSRFLGLLLMGLVFSVTSFTCTAPLLGGLLVLATQGNWFYPIVGMLAFSSIFALPFFVLALAPQLVAQLPRSGGWLNSVKVVMGFLEVAAAMKFISNVDLVWNWGIFTREVVLTTWVAVAVLIVAYLLGIFQFSDDIETKRVGAVRAMISFVFLSLGFYLLTGLFGQPLGELESFLPPKDTSAVTANTRNYPLNFETQNGELKWITNNFEEAMVKARDENKLVFIDFTGYTCTNCRWMEVNMFPREAVRRELDRYVRVRLYTDREGEPYEGFQRMQEERFKTVALPLYAILDRNGTSIRTFAGLTRDTEVFASFLRTN